MGCGRLVKGYNRGQTYFLKVDFIGGFKGSISIDLAKLGCWVKGLMGNN